MKPRSLLIWVALLALAAGGYYFSQSQGQKQEAAKDKAAKLVSLAEPLGVAWLEMAGSETPKPIRIERQDDKQRWVITAPVEHEADSMVMGRLLGSLLDAKVTERAAAPGRLADFGLDPPRISLTLADRQGAKSTVLLGDLSPSKEHLYAALPEAQEVLFLPAALRGDLARTLFDLRQKTALDFAAPGVKGITVSGPGGFALERRRGGADPQWDLAGGGEADPRAVEELVYQLRGLQTTSFLDEGINPERMGLDKPGRVIALTMDDGASLGLSLGGPVPGHDERYVRRLAGGPVMVVKNESLKRLERQPHDLIQRRLMNLPRDEVQALTIRRGEQTLAYAKVEGRFKRTQPPGDHKDGEAASLFLWDLAELKWDKVLAESGPALDNAGTVITLELASPAKMGETAPTPWVLSLEVVGERGAMVEARVSGDPRRLAISSSFIKNIPRLDPDPPGPGGSGGDKK